MSHAHSRAWLLRLAGLAAVSTIIYVVALRAHWSEPGPAVRAAAQEDKEKEVRTFLESVGAAYNRHDAKAVADSFHPEGELVDENGNVLRTREAIQSHYAEIFKNHPQSKMKVTNETLRLIGDSLAMFDGMAEVKQSAPEPLRRSRFAAVLSKQGNDWRIASIRDLEDDENDPTVVRDKLNSLSFLVGEWVQEEGALRIHTNCQWSEDKQSLIQKFTISGPNVKDLSGTQRIGWDPGTQKIKSWTHDAQGGHAEALWTSNGANWIVKSTATNSDGDACSMTTVYAPIDSGRIDLYFRDRIMGDDVMPDVAVTMVRKPPEAKP
jgi:uncharacterized protein (TIGR02246 family)